MVAATPMSHRSRLEDQYKSLIAFCPTRSTQTVCQMPVVRGVHPLGAMA
jgi:hypothetical protein